MMIFRKQGLVRSPSSLMKRGFVPVLLLLLGGGLAAAFQFSESAARAEKAPKPALARLGQDITVHAAGRGNPAINLSDGHEVVTDYEGPAELVQLLRQNQAQPLAMASADFDEDGVPDLITGYAGQGTGLITLLRGNVDAIYPNSPEAQARKAAGTFTNAPFLSPALVYPALQSPDFIGAGDFDGDGHWDMVTAARGGNRLCLLSGDGKGGLRLAGEVRLPGTVTALIVGEINRRDGLMDIVVATEAGAGAQVLVYQSAQGAQRAQPEVFNFSARVSALALGDLDDEFPADLAIAAGQELIVIRGRDQNISQGQTNQGAAGLRRHALPFGIRAIALGDFNGRLRTELALLSDDGEVYVMSDREDQQPAKVSDASWPQAAGLIGARLSGRAGDDLVVIDSAKRQLSLIRGADRRNEAEGVEAPNSIGLPAEPVTLDVKGQPLIVLPMRLNADARNDLVIGINSRSLISMVATVPAAVFTVNSTADGGDSNTSDGVCNDGTGACTFRAAIEQANASPGPDTINFNIGVGGYQVIIPTSVVYQANESVTIDGTTQPGFAGAPVIELKGGGVTSGSGLILAEANCTVRGLSIDNFGANGIHVVTSSGHFIEGNILGLNTSSVAGNGLHGIETLNSSSLMIGGTTAAARNIISGNRSDGVLVNGGVNLVIQGNYIGVNLPGTAADGNAGNGVTLNNSLCTVGQLSGLTNGAGNVIAGNSNHGVSVVTGNGSSIFGNYIGTDRTASVNLGNLADGININGGPTGILGNAIRFNGANGIAVVSGSGVTMFANSIYANQGLGIDLGGDEVTPNDAGDADTGPNNLQNFPNLTSVIVSGGKTFIRGTLNSTPNTTFSIFFYSSPACDPSGNGEGANLVDNIRRDVTTDGSGNGSFSFEIPLVLNAGDVVTATANDQASNYSEFSQCRQVQIPPSGFIVNSTGDGVDSDLNDFVCNDGSGNCTLRAAMEQANATPGANTISFNIGGGGPQTIAPASALPTITETVTIDGTSQPGFAGAPIIELSGANAGIANGLSITGPACRIKSLVINRFASDGILIRGSGAISNTITGNYIGTSRDGLSALPNGTSGIDIVEGASINTIGGNGSVVTDRNVISGNRGVGVFLQGNNTFGNVVRGNYIGVGADGTTPLGNMPGSSTLSNPGIGVLIGFGARGNTIGGFINSGTPAGNVIANNANDGIAIVNGSGMNNSDGNFISVNSIYSNQGLGIDLNSDGPTPNDDDDNDTGPNNLQNYPVLSSVTVSGAGVRILGRYKSKPGAYRIEYFYSPACSSFGYGEGRTWFLTESGNTNGDLVIDSQVPLSASPPLSSVVTATASDSVGNTSEFSACVTVTSPNGPNVRSDDVLVLPDLITAVGSGFTPGLKVSINNGVGFVNDFGVDEPAKVEDQGKRVTQAGRLSAPVYGSQTIDGLLQSGQPFTITFTNPNFGATSVQYVRPQLPPPNPNPPLVLTNITRSGGVIGIVGELTAKPSTTYVIYFRLTLTGETQTGPDGCPAREQPKTFLGSVKVKTDSNGKATFGSPVPVTFPDPSSGKTGIVSAYAIPFEIIEGQEKLSKDGILDSNCAGVSQSSSGVHQIQEITVTPDQITAIGYGFTDEVYVFINNVRFKKSAVVQGQIRQTVTQTGELEGGKTIAEMIPPGVVVRIRFRNSDGAFTEVNFRN